MRTAGVMVLWLVLMGVVPLSAQQTQGGGLWVEADLEFWLRLCRPIP